MRFVYDKIYLEHDTGDHPENAARLSQVIPFLEARGCDFLKPASGEPFLKLAHAKKYIEQIRSICASADKWRGVFTLDTPVCKKTYAVAAAAVGGAITAMRKNAFALVRPPGHHAGRNFGGGFCFFNNIAIAALASKKRTLIIDFDVHHGNGTQDIILGRENMFYFSTHQSPLYPGTGLHSEKNCINVPLKPGAGDAEFKKAVDSGLIPLIKKFEPEQIAVSAGFDSHADDHQPSLGNALNLTTASYVYIIHIVKEYPTFFVLEGGYSPTVIKNCVAALL